MDARIAWNSELGEGDLTFEGADLLLDEGLETAVMISLFSDARVTDQELPAGDSSRRGWWADELADIQNDRIGSKLWLLAREKSTKTARILAKQYVAEALQWLIDDGVATRVQVETEIQSDDTLAIAIRIERGDQDAAFKYAYNWKNQLARAA